MQVYLNLEDSQQKSVLTDVDKLVSQNVPKDNDSDSNYEDETAQNLLEEGSIYFNFIYLLFSNSVIYIKGCNKLTNTTKFGL